MSSGRDNRGNRDKGDRDRGGTKNRQSTFFINGAGIDREVITTDICRYLGNDALVRPGLHQDNHGNSQEGYYITAYRAPTSAQLQDLRSDSQKWIEEKRKTRGNTSSGIPSRELGSMDSRSNMVSVGYGSSATRAMIWGPAENEPSAVETYPPSYAPQPNQPPQPRGGPPTYGYGDAPPPQPQPPQPSYNNQQSNMPPPLGGGGYGRQDNQPYNTGAPSYIYASANPQLAAVNYKNANANDDFSRRGTNERDPRMVPGNNYNGGQPPSNSGYRTQPESFPTYAPTSNAAQPPSHYPGGYYGGQGPSGGFPPAGSNEEPEDIDPYGDEMEFDPPSGPPPSNAAPPMPSSRGSHREQESSNSNKRRQGHRN